MINYIDFALLSFILIVNAVVCLRCMLSRKKEKKDYYKEIRQVKGYAWVGIGCLLFFSVLFGYLLWKNSRYDGEKDIESIILDQFYLLPILLGTVIIFNAFNWRIRLYDNHFVYTNSLGITHTYKYDEIGFKTFNACSRYYRNGHWLFSISYLQDDADALENAIRRYRVQQRERAACNNRKDYNDLAAEVIYSDALQREREWRKTATQNDLTLLDNTINKLQELGLTEIKFFSDIVHRRIKDKRAIEILNETILNWDDIGKEAELIGAIGKRGNINVTEKIIRSYERIRENEEKGCSAFYDNALACIADKRYTDVYLRWANSWRDLAEYPFLMRKLGAWNIEEGKDIFLSQLFSKEDYVSFDPYNPWNKRGDAYMNAIGALTSYTDTDGRIENALKKVIEETEYKNIKEYATEILKKLKKE